MAPGVVGTPATTLTNVQVWSATLPAGVTSGELLMAHITITDRATSVANTQGWTSAYQGGEPGDWVGCYVFYKLAGASETNPSFSMDTPYAAISTTTTIFRIGGAGSPPINTVGAGGSNSLSGVNLVLPSATVTTPDALLLAFDSLVDALTVTSPSGMSELYDVPTATNRDRGHAGAYQVLSATGATGTRTFATTADTYQAGVLIAISGGAAPYAIGMLAV